MTALDDSPQLTLAGGPESLLHELLDVRARALALESAYAAELDGLCGVERRSAANLLHYLALRQFDLRDAQRQLARAGLSSLGRAEGHVLATLDAVIARLAADAGVRVPVGLGRGGPEFDEGAALLYDNSDRALGPPDATHRTRTMVTLPSDAARDASLVDQLIAQGMGIARINCAHDTFRDWQAMARNVRDAAARAGRDVRLAFDLAGQKLRVGALAPGPEVLRVRPQRDRLGRTVAPASVIFSADASTAALVREVCVVPIDADVVAAAQEGDTLLLTDARDKKRRFTVVRTAPRLFEATVGQSVYFTSFLTAHLHSGGRVVLSGRIGAVPPSEAAIELKAGDCLELRAGNEPGRNAIYNRGELVARPYVSVEAGDVIDRLEPGHRVLFDDGQIRGVVTDVNSNRALVAIEHPKAARLRAEKGVNFPDTELGISCLTDADLEALDAVVPIADLIALSFVSSPQDLDRLFSELDRRGAPERVGVVLKIERKAGFVALPDLLLRALRRPPVAVMVARGDLAVEVGFDRLAEVQEEILWLCEAAHVPVIWATQVLESLAKHGAPSRAEVTDARGRRAPSA